MVSVVIPALNESRRIAGVVEFARRSSLVSEVVVVDDGSVDGTGELAAAAGAKVITGSLLGKGAAMSDGLKATSGAAVVYLDGDLEGLDPHLIHNICEPLVTGRADFVKARFSREAGRVTMLTARPLLSVFFPELARFGQPLGGIIAAKRSLLESLRFETDYGVDLALLIDAHEQGAQIEEVDIGHLEHESQTLEALGSMAKQVVRVLLQRAERYGRLSIDQVREVEEVERHSRAEFSKVMGSVGQVEKLALFDMDGTLLRGRFVVELARRTGREEELSRWLDNSVVSDRKRSQAIAEIMRGIPREVFEGVAAEMPLTEGAVQTVLGLRKQGYRVGIVTDSYWIASEIVRRRVFADFSVANLIRFRQGVCTGELTIPPIFSHPAGCRMHELCKLNVALHIEEKLGIDSTRVLTVGDGQNDVCMLRASEHSFAFEPKSDLVRRAAKSALHGDLSSLLYELRMSPVAV